MTRIIPKIIVLAGTIEEYRKYLLDNNMTDADAVYGDRVEKMMGFRADKVDVVGTFWQRKNAKELYDFAHTRAFNL